MDNDAVVAIRMKYAEDLEEIIQCPVCFERPLGFVPTCVQGHHVCQKCQPKMKYCPICNNRFKGSRNYLAESLCAKLDDILSSLLDPRHVLNKKVLENKRCAGTQTEAPKQKTNLLPDCNGKAKSSTTAKNDKYMCRIGFCQIQLPPSLMFFHVRDFHKSSVLEAKAPYDGFIHYWDLEYTLGKLYDIAINIKTMGFFFLNLFINEAGNLYGNVQVVDTPYIERQFHYTMIVTNNETGQALGYDGPVQSHQLDEKFSFSCSFGKDLFECFFEKDSVTLRKYFRSITCRLILTRTITNEETIKQNSASAAQSSQP